MPFGIFLPVFCEVYFGPRNHTLEYIFCIIIFRDIIDFHIFFVSLDNLGFQFHLLSLLLLVWAFSALIINAEI